MKATGKYGIKVALAASLAAMSAAASAAVALGLGDPGMAIPPVAMLGIGKSVTAEKAASSQPPAEALRLNREALAVAPLDAAAWMRIAYIQSRQGAPLNTTSLEAIDRSYSVAPLGPDISFWRLRFLYEHWGEITPAMRLEATGELTTLVSVRGELFPHADISNPSGHLAAALTSQMGEKQRLQALERGKVAESQQP